MTRRLSRFKDAYTVIAAAWWATENLSQSQFREESAPKKPRELTFKFGRGSGARKATAAIRVGISVIDQEDGELLASANSTRVITGASLDDNHAAFDHADAAALVPVPIC